MQEKIETGTLAVPKFGADPLALDRTAHLIKQAGKATARALQLRLSRDGVAYGHWTLLRILWKHDGVSVTELSERASVTKPSAVVALNAMEDLGYVVRRQRPDNRKKIYIHLTPAGRELEAKLVPYALEVNAIAQRGLSPRHVDQLRSMLAAIVANLEDEDGDQGLPAADDQTVPAG